MAGKKAIMTKQQIQQKIKDIKTAMKGRHLKGKYYINGKEVGYKELCHLENTLKTL